MSLAGVLRVAGAPGALVLWQEWSGWPAPLPHDNCFRGLLRQPALPSPN